MQGMRPEMYERRAISAQEAWTRMGRLCRTRTCDLVQGEVDGGDGSRRGLGDFYIAELVREDLLDAMPQAGFRAGFHLRFFDDLAAMLHPDAYRSTFVFVHRVAHAEAAPAAGFILRHPCRRAGHGQQGEDHNRGYEPVFHRHLSRPAKNDRAAPIVYRGRS